MLKNKKMIYFIILMFAVLGAGIFAFSGKAQAAVTYYVCNSATNCNNGSFGWATGNDSNSGVSKSTPFLTIQKAADVVNPGDTVIVGSGAYTDSVAGGENSGVVDIKYNKGGSSGLPITFKSEFKHGAVLDGTRSAGWTASRNTGFYLYGTGTDHITIDGFEIKNTGSSGVVIQGGIDFKANHLS